MLIKMSRFLLFSFLCLHFFAHAERLSELEIFLKGPFIVVDDSQIYIYDIVFCKFYVYSKKNLQKITEFGNKGEGPGEFRTINQVTIGTETICVSNYPKVSIFSKKGKLIKELKAPPNASNFIPIGSNFVGVEHVYAPPNSEKDNYVFSIFNSNLKKKKTVYKAEFARIVKFQKSKVISRWFRDCTRAVVYNSKLFIGSTDRGFFFAVFDSEGNSLYEINRDYPKRKIRDIEKRKRIKKAKEVMGESQWNQLKARTEITFPEYYPAYVNFAVDDGKIYAYAFPVEKNQEILILDLKGKLLKRKLIPLIDIPGYIEHGCFCIHKGKMYYVVENEETEKCELHCQILDEE